MPLGTATPTPPATGSRQYSTNYPTSSSSASPTPASSSVPVTPGGYSVNGSGQVGVGVVGAAGPNYGIPQPAASNPYTNPYGSWGSTGTPGQGPSQSADPYITSLLNQFNAWSGNQQALNASNNGLQTGFAQAGYQNNLTATQQSAQSDLDRLMQQQYRDVTLGKQGNDISRLYNDKALGLAGDAYGLAGQQYGLAGQNRDLGLKGNLLNQEIQARANLSDAAGRGALSTSGYTQNDRDSLNKRRLADDSQLLQYAGAGLEYQNAGLQYKGAQNAHDEKNANLDINNAALDSLGKEYGIRAGDIKNQLQAATTKLGLDYASTVQQLNSAMTQGDQQVAQQAYNFLVQLMALPDTSASSKPTVPMMGNTNIPVGTTWEGTAQSPLQSAVQSIPQTTTGLWNQALGNAPATNAVSSFFGGLAGNSAYDNQGIQGDLNVSGMAKWMKDHGYTDQQIQTLFPKQG